MWTWLQHFMSNHNLNEKRELQLIVPHVYVDICLYLFCSYLCLWSVCTQGLHQVFHILHRTAFCKVGVGAQSPGIMKPLTAKDSLRCDDRIPCTRKHIHSLSIYRDHCHINRNGAVAGSGLTCEPAQHLCDASHDLLIRESLHIFWLVPSNPTTQHVAIPDISNYSELSIIKNSGCFF